MRQGPTQIGILAIFLVIISVFLAVLATLSLSTADADLRLSEKSADTTEKAYMRESAGQEWLAQVDAALASGKALSDMPDTETKDNTTVKVFTDNTNISLVVGLKEDGNGGYEIAYWKTVTDWTPDTSIGDLWKG